MVKIRIVGVSLSFWDTSTDVCINIIVIVYLALHYLIFMETNICGRDSEYARDINVLNVKLSGLYRDWYLWLWY